MKFRKTKILMAAALALSLIHITIPKAFASATVGANNEAFGFTFVSTTGFDPYWSIDQNDVNSFYETVGSYAISGVNSNSLNTKITGTTIYSNQFSDTYYYYSSVEKVYNSTHSWDDNYDSEYYDDDTKMGSGDGWLYAIENNGEIQYAYGSKTDSHQLTFSKTLSQTMYIYIPVCYEYTVAAEYTNSNYQFGVVKYAFNISTDTEAPTLTCGVPNGGYTAGTTTITADDPNFYRLYYKRPGSSSYSYTTSKTYTTTKTNGVFYFYAEDTLGNRSNVYSITCDVEKPVGNITSGGVVVSSGSYITKSFVYTATDALSGIKACYYKTPKMSSYQEYISGTAIPADSGDGTYYFYAVDTMGNQSEVKTVTLETKVPTVEIYKNGKLVYSEPHTSGVVNANIYVKPTDTLKYIYNSSSGEFTANYTENTNIPVTGTDMMYIQITSSTGVKGSYRIYIVDQEPYVTINGVDYKNGQTLDINTDVTGTAKLDAIIQSFGECGITIETLDGTKKINYTDSKSFSLTSPEGIETKYKLILDDPAGNNVVIYVNVDKEAPTCNLYTEDGTEIESGRYINKNFYIDYDEAEMSSVTYSLNGAEYQTYNGEIFEAEGVYNIVLIDKALNKSNYQVIIDKSAPKGELYANYELINNNSVVNKDVYFTWNDAATCTLNGQSYIKNTVIKADGVYKFVLTDLAGNQSVYTVEIDTASPTVNKDNLLNKHDYTISKWYRVEYENIVKSFKNYEDALAYAKALETKKYVTTLQLDNVDSFKQYHLVATTGNAKDEVKVGDYYRYKSMSNSQIDLYYFDKALLDEAITFYAKNFVSGVNYYTLNGDNVYGDKDVSMFDDIWTSVEGIDVVCVNDYSFVNTDSSYITAIRVGDSTEREVLFDVPFKDQFSQTGMYLITERDSAGNISTYYVYLDKSAPELVVDTLVFGEEDKNTITISKEDLNNISAYYYKSFEIKSIVDADTWASIAVTKGRSTSYYSYGDTLPTLSEGGKYNITVYDRLNNSYSFTVYIVGNEATISFDENSDSTEVYINIKLEQEFDAIISLEIFKDGVKQTNVSPDTLDYTFTKDGLYKVVLKDNFGRVTEAEYDFVKSLPQGNPSVENGTKTTNNITFTFDEAKYYVVLNDELNITNGVVNLTENGSYSLKLINLTDEENYSLYNFEIDRIAPSIQLIGVEENATTNKNVTVSWSDNDVVKATYKLNDGDAVDFTNATTFKLEGIYEITVVDDLGNEAVKFFEIDKVVDYVLYINNAQAYNVDVTSQNVSLASNEPLTVTVTKDGELMSYDFGSVIYDEGYYVFHVEDAHGNSVTFAIMIDKTVELDINVLSGAIANEDVVINALEEVSIIMSKDGNPIEYKIGDAIKEEGTYKATCFDAYGNQRIITFEIVKGVKTSLNYAIDSDIEILSITRNGEDIVWNSNILNFTEDGLYQINCMKNDTEYSFTLELDTTAPTIKLSGVEAGGKVDGKVVIEEISEVGIVEVYRDDVKIDYELGQELSEYGKYKVVVTDSLGNTQTITFELAFQMNGWAIFLIILGIILVAGGIVAIRISKRTVYKKKGK